MRCIFMSISTENRKVLKILRYAVLLIIVSLVIGFVGLFSRTNLGANIAAYTFAFVIIFITALVLVAIIEILTFVREIPFFKRQREINQRRREQECGNYEEDSVTGSQQYGPQYGPRKIPTWMRTERSKRPLSMQPFKKAPFKDNPFKDNPFKKPPKW